MIPMVGATLGAAVCVVGLVGAVMAIPIAATVKVVMSPMITSMDEPPPEPEAAPEAPPPVATRSTQADRKRALSACSQAGRDPRIVVSAYP
jgi:hypothetical protein